MGAPLPLKIGKPNDDRLRKCGILPVIQSKYIFRELDSLVF